MRYSEDLNQIIRFYREGAEWFADLPEWENQGNDKAELQMVDGADVWLDYVSEGGKEVTLEISSTFMKDPEAKLLYVGDIPSSGNKPGDYLVYPQNHYLWLCRVAVWLFGQYPQSIYYKII